MRIFSREPLHAKLAREGGVDLEEKTRPLDTTPHWDEAGIHGIPRPREWDAVAMRDVPALGGGEHEFVALPDGTLLVEGDADEESVNVLADALRLEPPYRAWALRRHEATWAVGARRIEIAALPDAPVGAERIELTEQDGERSLVVDGERIFGGIRSLERLGDARYASWAAEAERLDGDLFEIRISPL